MPSLKKVEILYHLKHKYGISLKSVQKLNKLLEEMGILRRMGDSWRATDKGLPFTIFTSTQVVNPDLWRDTVVDAIAEYYSSSR